MKTDKTVTRNFEKFQRPAKKFHFRAGSTDPWPKVLRDFDDFVSINPVYQPMRRLVYSLYACASGNLHARQTMGGNLILSPEEELHQDDNLLLISYCSEQRLFHIEHRTLSKNDDSKEVGIEDVWSAVRLFAGYKFGIKLPVKQPEPDVALFSKP